MKQFLIVLGLMIMWFPLSINAQTLNTPLSQEQLKTIASLQVQILALQTQLKAMQGQEEVTEEWKFNYSQSNVKLGAGKEDETSEADDSIRRYLVQNNRLYEDGKWTKDTDVDEYKMWNIFANIADESFIDKYITRYATYRNGDTGVLGFVRLLDDEGFSWGLAVNANASNFSSKKWSRDLVAVLIHEYTHVLTLNGDQVNHKRKQESVCRGNYLSNKGCTEKKSYLNNYVAQFWDEEDFSRKTPSKEKYFKEHPNEFVTEYALKSPEEDIAESFTQFILYEKPTGTKQKDLKVLFFYNYPELVKERERIRIEIEQYFD